MLDVAIQYVMELQTVSQGYVSGTQWLHLGSMEGNIPLVNEKDALNQSCYYYYSLSGAGAGSADTTPS